MQAGRIGPNRQMILINVIRFTVLKKENRLFIAVNKYILNPGEIYFINGHSVVSQECLQHMSVDWLHFIPDSVYLDHILRIHSCVHPFNSQKLFSFVHVFDKFGDYFNNRLSENNRRILTVEIQSLIQYMISQVFKLSADKKIESD